MHPVFQKAMKEMKIVFPILRDGTGLMQCVAVKSALPEEVFEELKHLTQESSLIVRGKLRAEARADLRYWDAKIAVLADTVAGAHWTPHQPELLQTMTLLLGPPERVDDVWLWRV